MNIPDIHEVRGKETKVREYLVKNGYDAMIIGRIDNFAWFTDGGNSKVILPSETGFALIVITRLRRYLISQVMDMTRIMEEELEGIDFDEYIPLHWYEVSREEKAMELVKGCRVISDIPVEGAECLPDEIYKLHYPLTSKEIAKLRWLGDKAEEIITEVAFEISPGMSEHEIEAMLMYRYARENINCNVLLTGSDERIFKYRHPNPSSKRIDKYVLLAPVPSRWGLNAPLTRLIYFGDKIPLEIEEKYNAVCRIAAAAISMCVTGTKFSDILAMQKKLYKEMGYENEWKNHYQGGVTGYRIVNASLCNDPESIVQINEAYAWFITITGVKSEELSVNTGDARELLTVTGKWPTKEYDFNNQKLKLPEILKR